MIHSTRQQRPPSGRAERERYTRQESLVGIPRTLARVTGLSGEVIQAAATQVRRGELRERRPREGRWRVHGAVPSTYAVGDVVAVVVEEEDLAPIGHYRRAAALQQLQHARLTVGDARAVAGA